MVQPFEPLTIQNPPLQTTQLQRRDEPLFRFATREDFAAASIDVWGRRRWKPQGVRELWVMVEK